MGNVSTSVDMPTLSKAVTAIGLQVSSQFQPAWNLTATLGAQKIALAGMKIAPPLDGVIYLGDSSQDSTSGAAGANAYHARNFNGKPYGFVYLDVCLLRQEPWSVALSHEVLEMIADPDLTKTRIGPDPRPGAGAGDKVRYALEVCDPTEGDGYDLNGTSVCNFVTPGYFAAPGAPSGTNHLGVALAPFKVRPKGYIEFLDDDDDKHRLDGPAIAGDLVRAREILGRFRRTSRRTVRKFRAV